MLVYGRHLPINTKFTRITQIELIQDNSNCCWPFFRQLDRLDDKSDEERPNHQNQSTARELFRILKLLSWAEAGVRGKSFLSPSFSQHAAKHIEYESRVVCAYLFLRKQPPPAEKSSTATYLSKGSIRKIPQPLSLSLSHSLARSSRRLIFSHSRSGLLYVIYTPVLVGPIRVLPAL